MLWLVQQTTQISITQFIIIQTIWIKIHLVNEVYILTT